MCGQVAEWLKAADCKSARASVHRFESYPVHHLPFQSLSVAIGHPLLRGFYLSEQHIYRVAIVGTGFSGICAAIKLLEKSEEDFVVIEKADAVGGTWRENTYPGAACDIPAPLYCYSFEPNPRWSRLYPPQDEIRAYIVMCADKYEVTPHIRFNQRLTNVRFDDTSGIWSLEVEGRETIRARHVIMGHGGLHKPAIPDFEGLPDFGGPAFHTATWDHSVDLSDKRVAVIGSAASAIQVTPELAKTASRLSVFQRTPNYIAARGDRELTCDEKTVEGQLALRQFIFEELQSGAEPVIPAGSHFGKQRQAEVIAEMRAIIDDKSLCEALTPDYDFGCKRILISDNFYQSLNSPNVDLVIDGVAKFEKGAIVTVAGKRIELDAVIFATGFDLANHSMSIQYWGRGGKNLLMRWMHGVDTYRGAQIPEFPNLYFVTGPNTGVATTSVVVMVEAELEYILALIEAAGPNGLIEPRDNYVKAEDTMLQDALSQTVWAKGGCASWYLDTESDRISTLYPFGVGRFTADREGFDPNAYLVEQRG